MPDDETSATPGGLPEGSDVASALLARFVDLPGMLVGWKSQDGRYVYANAALARVLSGDGKALIGRTDAELLEAASARRIAQRDDACLRSGEPVGAVDEFVVGETSTLVASLRRRIGGEAADGYGIAYVGIAVADVAARDDGPQDVLGRALDSIRELQDALHALEAKSTHDRLTGALTRAGMEDAGRYEMLRLARYGQSLSLVFVDIDNLKAVNDRFGHSGGDALLARFADVARETIRLTDRFGRWGGDEFLLLLPHTPLASAALLANRLRGRLRAASRGEGPRLAASFGVAEAAQDETWEAFVARADAAMYRAKRAGRNRVEVDASIGASSAAERPVDGGFIRLAWHQAYGCGEPTIDAQHEELFAIANALLGAVVGQAPRDEVQALMDDLVAKCHAHFHYEEALLRRRGYPDVEAHAGVHAAIMRRATSMAQACRLGRLDVGESFTFLAHELSASHLLGEDRKFFGFLAGARG